MKPLIYAHRGASGHAPENTMAAFRLAEKEGADAIELDIQMSADGRLVVIHDETLERTTDGKGSVAALTYNELSRLNACAGFANCRKETIPLLSQVLAYLAPTALALNIELKNSVLPYSGMEEAVIRMVREYGMERRVVFSSFNHYSVSRLAHMAPDIECAILYVSGLPRPWEYAADLGARGLHPQFYDVSRELVDYARRLGIKVRPWTVDDEPDMTRMIATGADAVITNYPARLRSLLKRSSPSR